MRVMTTDEVEHLLEHTTKRARNKYTKTTIVNLCNGILNERKLKEIYAKDYCNMKKDVEPLIVALIEKFGANPDFYKLAKAIGINLSVNLFIDNDPPNTVLKVSNAHTQK